MLCYHAKVLPGRFTLFAALFGAKGICSTSLRPDSLSFTMCYKGCVQSFNWRSGSGSASMRSSTLLCAASNRIRDAKVSSFMNSPAFPTCCHTDVHPNSRAVSSTLSMLNLVRPMKQFEQDMSNACRHLRSHFLSCSPLLKCRQRRSRLVLMGEEAV